MYADPTNNPTEANRRMSSLIGTGQTQDVFSEVINRAQSLYVDPTISGRYPAELTRSIAAMEKRIEELYNVEAAVVTDAQSAAGEAINAFALSYETMGFESGLDAESGFVPRLAINAPTAQILVGDALSSYWGPAQAARLDRFRALVIDASELQSAHEYWTRDFASYLFNNPNSPAPTWEYLTSRYPVPKQTTTSASASGLPGWLWIVLGGLVLLLGS